MKFKSLWIVAAVASFCLVGTILQPETGFTNPPPKKIKAQFSKDGKKVKVQKIDAQKDDEVEWTASDGDLYFQFMDSDLFGDYNYMVKKGNTLTLTVKGKKGTYHYSIFSIADSSYVEGNSPPAIIIF